MGLRLEGVSKRVGGELHLADIDLALEDGTLCVLLGRTGAGKTSLMRVMAGLDRPTSGRVLAGGEDVTGRSVRQRDVAFVYQQFINYPSFRVYDNIASPLRFKRGLGGAEIDRRVRETARLLHIEALLDRLPAELSGGQQQRTALARALVKGASLLLLDEPLVNLDYKLREELRAELREIFRRSGTIVVYATTEPHEALLLGGRVVVMHEGRVLQTGPTLEVFRNPATLLVGQLFSDPPMNTAEVELRGDGTLRMGDVELSAPRHLRAAAPGRYAIGVRPNHLTVRPAKGVEVAIPGRVELAEVNGSETVVHLRHAGGSWVMLETGVHTARIGDEMVMYLDPARLFLFDAAGDGRLVASPNAAGGPVPAEAA